MSPNPASVPINGTQQFTAVGKDANGNIVAVAGPVWSVVNGGGSIDANTGVFTAGAVVGTFTLSAALTAGSTTKTRARAWGRAEPGGWSPGVYRAECTVGETLIARGSFVVEP